MLSKADNDLITNTNAGTPMGEVFRRFWLPVALADELTGSDCVPVRIRILGEDLVGFRDTQGRPGLVDAYCPHRGAAMFFGRNEDSGLRCVYHGWKFDVQGNCVDLPNAPEGETFKQKVKTTAYPCVEAGGLIWAFMGPAEKKPPFPKFEWCNLPRENIYLTKFAVECNYLQALDGEFDPSHPQFLHSSLDGSQGKPRLDAGRSAPLWPGMDGRRVIERPEDRIEEMDGGFLYFTVRDREGQRAASVLPWMAPIFCTAGVDRPGHFSSNMRVPVDNEHLMFFRLRWSYSPMTEDDVVEYKLGGYMYPELVPGTWKTRANKANDYEIDRGAQKYLTFTGIKGTAMQDIAVTENQWGPLADRTKEHLTSMDNVIIYLRRRLLNMARALAEGSEPTEPWHPEAYVSHRGIGTAETSEKAIELARLDASRSRIQRAAPLMADASANRMRCLHE